MVEGIVPDIFVYEKSRTSRCRMDSTRSRIGPDSLLFALILRYRILESSVKEVGNVPLKSLANSASCSSSRICPISGLIVEDSLFRERSSALRLGSLKKKSEMVPLISFVPKLIDSSDESRLNSLGRVPRIPNSDQASRVMTPPSQKTPWKLHSFVSVRSENGKSRFHRVPPLL